MIRISACGLAIAAALMASAPGFAQLGANANANAGAGNNAAALNVNAATVQQLVDLGFAQNAAQAIVQRAHQHALNNVQQLLAIPGVNAGIVNNLVANGQLAVGPVQGALNAAGGLLGGAGNAAGGLLGGAGNAVNINAANAAQLQALGFSMQAAHNVVAQIQGNGAIANVQQLLAVPGVNANVVNNLAANGQLAFGPLGAVGGVVATAGNAVGGVAGGVPVNVNAANAAQLQGLGISVNVARSIVAFIQTNGPINNIGQLNGVAGANATLLNTLAASGTLIVQ